LKDSILNLVLQRMAQGYEEQVPLYQQMYALALEQEETLRSEEVNTDQLVDLINRRQDLIDNLEELNGEIARLKGEVCAALGIDDFIMSKIRERMSGPGVDELGQAAAHLARLLQQIKDLDKTNEDTLRLRIKDTKEKLAQLQNAKKANNAYRPQTPNKDGVFVDFSK